ncbi:MAG TPA: FkbM family methyltransferase [Dyella sp.]|uniref:FkbM family methyltransferase n=1 Tax=Dyella sp. TaxID=1869338 RepID=UPI002C951C22|nr:FkbM family methyltransferase [Dyella sp.]HTV87287.1 FkbM family methyltransferase [Dyella sp.]
MNQPENAANPAIAADIPAIFTPVHKALSKAVPSVPLWNTRYGMVHDNQADDVIARSLSSYGEWAEQELDLVGALLDEGNVALQYGAEHGAHALYMSKLVGVAGEVHVVEPRRLPHIALCTALGLNNVRNVHPWQAALGDRQGSVDLPASTDQPEERVRMLTLDALKLSALHLLKINLHGCLLALLSGAGETLRKHKPAIYFRLSTLESAANEVAALKETGYRCWSHLPYLYNAGNFAENKRNIFPGWSHQNVIAVHRDAPVNFQHLPEI